MVNLLLVLNAGSSSIKFGVFAEAGGAAGDMVLRGRVEGLGARPRLVATNAAGGLLVDQAYAAGQVKDHDQAIGVLAAWLPTAAGQGVLVAAGHRVAHGGMRFGDPVLIDDEVLSELDRLAPLAPLHQPANVAGIRALRARKPELPQVACFDTAFHRRHGEIADRFALPEGLYREGVRRYGFHGLSYDYIARRLPAVAPEISARRIVVAHLGNGASLCGMIGGRSVDTTMSFSSLDGLPMGTRCGPLDPGVLIYLLREKGMSVEAVETLLYTECGLLGLSGVSSDMRDLEASDAPSAKLALDYYIYHICRQIASLAGAMAGIDAIVFTAGIGEKSKKIRKEVCGRLAWLGVDLDDAANEAGGPRITSAASGVSVWVIPTDEECAIASYTVDLLRAARAGGAK
ncbi:MAG TPA: acetate/propionate family kinase [Acidocella sp.]|jgi:acetate kinase|nr:acetate/propionate family kinase [Acidocella sp.]